MIQALANKITKHMDKLGVLSESIEIHQYGVETILSTLISFIWILLLSFLYDRVIDGIIYIIGFYIIRKFSGGYHCNTYFCCITLYVCLFVIYLLTYSVYDKIRLFIIIFSIIAFSLYVPVHNRKLNQEEYKMYKLISFVLLSIYIWLSCMSTYSSIFSYLILVVTILIIAGIRKYEIKSI